MNWFTISGQELIDKGPNAWSAIRDRCPVAHPLLHGRFLDAALRVLPLEPKNVHLACTTGDDRAGYALLLENKGLGMWETFDMPQIPISLMCSVGRVEEAHARLFKRLFVALPGPAWAIKLMRYDTDYSPALDTSLHPHLERIPAYRTLRVDIAGSFEQYWASRSKNLRGSLRGVLNRMSAEGKIARLESIVAPDDMNAAVEQHGQLEASGWKGAAGSSLDRASREAMFYREVLTDFARHGKARVFRLYIDADLAASQMTLVDGGIQVLLKTAYRPDLGRFAPGRLLDYFMLQAVFKEGLANRVEYCTTASDDDLRWATADRVLYQINVFRAPLLRKAMTPARRIKRLFKSNRLVDAAS